MKPTNKQLKICQELISIIKGWSTTNDIHSPSHWNLIEESLDEMKHEGTIPVQLWPVFHTALTELWFAIRGSEGITKTFDDLRFEVSEAALSLKEITKGNYYTDPCILDMMEVEEAKLKFPNGWGIQVLWHKNKHQKSEEEFLVYFMYGPTFCEELGDNGHETCHSREEVSNIMKWMQHWSPVYCSKDMKDKYVYSKEETE